MTHKQCCACGKLLGNCRERRKLFSEATRHVAPQVHQGTLCSPCFSRGLEERVSQLLAADSFICKSDESLPLAGYQRCMVAQRSKDSSHSQLGAPQKRQRKRELQLQACFHVSALRSSNLSALDQHSGRRSASPRAFKLGGGVWERQT